VFLNVITFSQGTNVNSRQSWRRVCQSMLGLRKRSLLSEIVQVAATGTEAGVKITCGIDRARYRVFNVDLVR